MAHGNQKYTMDDMAEICRRVSLGENLGQILKDEGMPNRDTVYEWRRKYPDFADMYARAREDRSEVRVEQIQDVIEDMRDGRIDYNVARVQIDVIKWQSGKENRGLYGDSSTTRLANADGSNLDLVAALQAIDGKTAGLPKDDA
jgi:hypothetical protein